MVLGFPDTYEIGISNQAIQILYHLARQTEGVAVERTYLPWVDVIAEMRREGVPLLTLETWSPVAEADLLGLTLQHEFNYTNLLEMLDLAGIPLRAAERTEQHPLVLAGGPACADFLPLSRFLDAVAVGDGEELFPEILRVAGRGQATRRGREPKRSAGSALIDGVFVPGVSASVDRAECVPRLEGAPYPGSCLVPLTAGVHDRAWVEIMRGCTRGCRFCQAGMWYRPVRERSPAEVLAMAAAQLRDQRPPRAGLGLALHHRLLVPRSSCWRETARAHPEVRVSLPSLRVDSAAVRLAHLASPTGPSLTLAPEAGSQRMRDVINKNVTEADVLAAAEEAFRAGRTTLKLYFMIGLPLERGRGRRRHRRPLPAGARPGPARAGRPGGAAAAQRERQQLHPQAVHAVPVGGHGRPGRPCPRGRICCVRGCASRGCGSLSMGWTRATWRPLWPGVGRRWAG